MILIYHLEINYLWIYTQLLKFSFMSVFICICSNVFQLMCFVLCFFFIIQGLDIYTDLRSGIHTLFKHKSVDNTFWYEFDERRCCARVISSCVPAPLYMLGNVPSYLCISLVKWLPGIIPTVDCWVKHETPDWQIMRYLTL